MQASAATAALDCTIIEPLMQREATPVADIGLALFLIAVCATALWETRKIPPGTFEPLGSAPVPQAVAGIIILLCLLVIARALVQLKTKRAIRSADEAVATRHADAVAVFLLTVVYCLGLHFRVMDFALLTMIFLLVTIGLLIRFRTGSLVWIILVAVLMSYGSEYVFTQVFVVDLPGAY